MEERREKRHNRSYVIRKGRMTQGQSRAIEELGPRYLIPAEPGTLIDFAKVFGNDHPVVLEIGFGMGRSLMQMAQDTPGQNFVGIEVYPPGIGSALAEIGKLGLVNVRLINHDAYEVVSGCIAPNSLDAVQIFFPDPWPKLRHHKRRLINDEFVQMLRPLLKSGGEIRMATDWENYALQMLEVMSRAAGFLNQSRTNTFVARPAWRPLTKFEERGQKLDHGVWDLVFTRE